MYNVIVFEPDKKCNINCNPPYFCLFHFIPMKESEVNERC